MSFQTKTFYRFFIYLIICILLVSCIQSYTMKSDLTIDINKEYNTIKYNLITALINHEYEQAKSYLTKFEKTFNKFNTSQKCDYYYFNGCYLFLMKQYSQAEEKFSSCLFLNPAYIQALFSRAELRLSFLQRYDESYQDSSKLLEVLDYAEQNEIFNDNSPITIYTICKPVRLMTIKNIPSYLKPFSTKQDYMVNFFVSKTMTSNELRFRCYANMNSAKYQIDDILSAIECVKEILKLRPGEMHYIKILGDYYIKLEKYKDAMIQYNTYINFDDQWHEVYYKRGICYFLLKEYSSAVNDLSTSMTKMKSTLAQIDSLIPPLQTDFSIKENERLRNDYINLYESALLFRGRCYGKLEQYNKGITDLTSVLDINSSNEQAYYYRGYFYNYTGKRNFALFDFKQALKLNPMQYQLYYSIALIYDTQKKYDQAVQYYEKYTNKTSDTSSQKYLNAINRIENISKSIKK